MINQHVVSTKCQSTSYLGQGLTVRPELVEGGMVKPFMVRQAHHERLNHKLPHLTHQSGVVLVISLIMLLALTLIGVTSSSVTGLEEKMAANNKDKNLAFQAAEAALRDAEASLTTPKPSFDRASTNADQGVGSYAGYYTLLNNDERPNPQVDPTLKDPQPQNDAAVNNLPFYSNIDWVTATNPRYRSYTNVSGGVTKLVGLSRPPEYMIEELSSVFSGSVGGVGGAGSSLGGGTDAPPVALTSWVMTYRITAHGWGSNANSVATVQSVVKVTYPIP